MKGSALERKDILSTTFYTIITIDILKYFQKYLKIKDFQ